jgi:hypothetical protein
MSCLTEDHELVLALFKYGLAHGHEDVAGALGIEESVAHRLCRDLVAAGLVGP